MNEATTIDKVTEKNVSKLDFLKKREYAKDFSLWCQNHGVEENGESAELYFDMTVETETAVPQFMYFV